MKNNQKPSYLKFALAWLVYGFIWLIAQLPYRLLRALGLGLGKLLQVTLKSRAKVVKTNLSICFPQLTDLQRKQLQNLHYKELGQMFTQTIKAFLGNTSKIEQPTIIHGAENIERCLENKQGILLITAHFTALEIGGKILCNKYPIAGMYRPHKHPLTEYIVRKSRLTYACKMFKRDQLRPIVKHLKNGGILWYAPDQNYRRGQSVFAPFFGRPASTITATHQLARLSGCKIIFFHIQRNNQAPYYTLTISKPLDDFPSKDPVHDTSRINQGIEAMIKKNPQEYLWMHKRFKKTPNGEKSPY
jgi:KDO2-lipid IV(A) lauroyltransferase